MKKDTKTLSLIALFAALNYAVFSFGKIDISLVAGSSVAIHAANAVVVLSAIALGPVEGGLAGAIGLSLADLLDPRYVMSAPKTFFLKFCIGYLSGRLAQKLKLTDITDSKKAMLAVMLSAAVGLGFNVIFDPIVGYLYKRFLLGVPADAASIILAWTGGVSAFNAVVCFILSVLFYMALRVPLRQITKNK